MTEKILRFIDNLTGYILVIASICGLLFMSYTVIFGIINQTIK